MNPRSDCSPVVTAVPVVMDPGPHRCTRGRPGRRWDRIPLGASWSVSCFARPDFSSPPGRCRWRGARNMNPAVSVGSVAIGGQFFRPGGLPRPITIIFPTCRGRSSGTAFLPARLRYLGAWVWGGFFLGTPARSDGLLGRARFRLGATAGPPSRTPSR